MRRLYCFLGLFFSVCSLFAQEFFSPEKMLETGVYYYPEAWSPEQWERDIRNISELGFEFIHMAEFSWVKLEPEEGRYDFDWLDRVIELSAKYNLKVILGTPTPTPPVWLSKKYPEILLVLESGERAQHGTREHYSWSSTRYREFTTKIVTEMAKRYGKNKCIWGWQIDNEPSHYGVVDYSEGARVRFIEWLKNKYATIENLNHAWGTAFWSATYNSFDQIEIPSKIKQVTDVASQHSILDYKRFSADECASFVSLQFKVLKQHIDPSQFVTTNFMHHHSEVIPWLNDDLDFICYTMYPISARYEGLGNHGFRLGEPSRISYANDFFRPLRGMTGVMELQPGQINWATFNPQLYPGVVRAWLWNSFAGGLSFACTYRYRQPLFGCEQYHYGIVGTDGVTLSSGGEEYKQFMEEMKTLRKLFNPDAPCPADYAARKTAFLYNPDNLWDTEIGKQTFQWDFKKHMNRYYSAVKSLCAPVDFISEASDFKKFNVMVAPAYQLIDEQLVEKWKRYIEDGGNLVLTCRTGQKDRNGHFFELKWAAHVSELIGADIKMFDHMPDNQFATVTFDGENYDWNNWGDIIDPGSDCEVWATYADQFYAGKAAVVHRKVWKGSVTYIGCDTDSGVFEKDVLKKVYLSAGIEFIELPNGVNMHWRDGFWVAINYSSEAVSVDIPANAEVVIGENKLQPAQVVVWR